MDVRKIILITAGSICFLVGLVFLPFPVPFAFLLMMVGLALLVSSSETVRHWFHGLRDRFPKLDGHLRNFEQKLPASLRRTLSPEHEHQEAGE